MKRCPKCKEEKSLDGFYAIKGRKDGHASWCKVCSNSARKHHKRSEYSVVAKLLAAGEVKPLVCPCCDAQVASRRMGCTLKPDGTPQWSCWGCRKKTVTVLKLKRQYCNWCCDPFRNKVTRDFCSNGCKWAWFEKRAVARARPSSPPTEETTFNEATL